MNPDHRRTSALLVPFFLLALATVGQSQSLAPGATAPTGDAPRAVAVADFNRDGTPDVVTADGGAGTVTITFVHAAPWTFTRETARVGTGPFDIVAADFSGDGYPDVAVANADSDSVSVLLYQPSRGTFTGEHSGDPSVRPIVYTFATGANPRGLAAADFTGDGRLDLAVSLYAGNKIEVYRGDGTGHFTLAGGSAVLGGNPQGVATGDIDHDGRIDLAVARNGGTVVTLFGDGAGNLGRRRDIAGSGAGRTPALADLDGNGTLDLALVGFGDTVSVFSSSYSCDGTPCFWQFDRVQTVALAAGSNPRDIEVADVNRDGRPDLVTANRGSNDIAVIAGRASGGFAAPLLVPLGSAGHGARAVGLADFNHDGRLDVVTGNEYSDNVAFGLNTISLPPVGLGFRAERLLPRDRADGIPTGLCLGDLNADGRVDAVFPRDDGIVTWMGNIAGPTHSESELRGGPAMPRGCAIADFDNEGHANVAVIGLGGNIYAWDPDDDLSDSAGFASVTTTAGARPLTLAAGRFDQDAFPDLVVANVDGSVTVYLSDGYRGRSAQRFHAAATKVIGATLSEMVVADFNRDGRDDVAGVDSDHGTVFLPGDGRGGFGAAVTLPGGFSPFDLNAADFNQDGRLDLAVINDSAELTILIGDGRGGFAVGHSYLYEDSPYGPPLWRLTSGDVNHDGRVDLVLGGVALLFGRGDGSFEPELRLDPRFGGPSPIVADADGDGLNDILSVSWGGDGAGLNVFWNRAWTGNIPPVAAAGVDRSVPADSSTNLDGRGSYDLDAHDLLYEWREETGTVVGRGARLLVNRHAGSYLYTLTVRDPFGATATDDVRITFLSAGSTNDVVLYAAEAPVVAGTWRVVADASAAGGRKIYQPDAGAGKVVTASAAPANYFELSFDAEAGRPYHLWIRGKADGNSYANDSVHVQFSDSVLSTGQPIWRIGSTSSTEWNLEQCSNCGEAGWGWECPPRT